MSDIPKNLIILGPQGSGKGTQAKLLEEKFGYLVLGAGDILREIAKEDSELGRQIHQIINVEGRFAPADLVAEVFESKISSISKDQKIILESFPRNLEQYNAFEDFWAKMGRGGYVVLFINLQEDEAIERLSTRYICEGTGKIYALFNKEEVEKAKRECEQQGGRLVQREDDKPEAISMRFKLFQEATLPMVKKMRQAGRVIHIDGAPPIEKVHEQIAEKLNLK